MLVGVIEVRSVLRYDGIAIELSNAARGLMMVSKYGQVGKSGGLGQVLMRPLECIGQSPHIRATSPRLVSPTRSTIALALAFLPSTALGRGIYFVVFRSWFYGERLRSVIFDD